MGSILNLQSQAAVQAKGGAAWSLSSNHCNTTSWSLSSNHC